MRNIYVVFASTISSPTYVSPLLALRRVTRGVRRLVGRYPTKPLAAHFSTLPYRNYVSRTHPQVRATRRRVCGHACGPRARLLYGRGERSQRSHTRTYSDIRTYKLRF